jgi:hypothetical protein
LLAALPFLKSLFSIILFSVSLLEKYGKYSAVFYRTPQNIFRIFPRVQQKTALYWIIISRKAKRQAISLLYWMRKKPLFFWNRTVNCLQNITFIWNIIADIPKASRLIQPQNRYYLLLDIVRQAAKINLHCINTIPYL